MKKAGHKFRNHGFSLIELLAANFLILVAIWSFFSGLNSFKKSQAASSERWKAQLLAESVTDIVSSMQPSDQYSQYVSSVNAADFETPFYTDSSEAWISNWKSKLGSSTWTIKFQIQFFNLQAAIIKPTAVDYPLIDKKIYTEVTYQRSSQAPLETIKWEKWIPGDSP